MFLNRILDLNFLLAQKSFFLFGSRATGKTSLIRHQLADKALIIDLLRSDIYLRLNNNPSLIEGIIATRKTGQDYIVIDEVQKIPLLLNEVHRLIEEQKLTFLLTGSSARKLRQQNVNLLAGRAWETHLYPLCSREIPNFDLQRYLQYGGLPNVYLSNAPREELIAYVDTYLKEEIRAEALVRRVHAFSRFLQVAALSSGKMLNFSTLANDIAIPASTVREYFQILQDTLIGFLLPAWTKTVKRKALSTAKFYFFDLGVRHQLAGIEQIPPQSDICGQAFEQFIAIELQCYLSYQRLHKSLSYWQSKHGHEVDFIIGDETAIEVKTSSKIANKHLKGLFALQEEKICKNYILVSFDKVNRVEQGIQLLYWEDFLEKLWEGQFTD